MSLTDTAELLEVLSGILQEGQDISSLPMPTDTESYLCLPMAALSAKVQGFSEVFGPDGRVLENLARLATDRGDEHLASVARAINYGLENNNLDVQEAPETAQRSLRFVYPVV